MDTADKTSLLESCSDKVNMQKSHMKPLYKLGSDNSMYYF